MGHADVLLCFTVNSASLVSNAAFFSDALDASKRRVGGWVSHATAALPAPLPPYPSSCRLLLELGLTACFCFVVVVVVLFFLNMKLLMYLFCHFLKAA